MGGSEVIFVSISSNSVSVAYHVSSGQAINMLAGECGPNSIYTWYNFYRGIMSRTFLEAPVQLWGPNTMIKWMRVNRDTSASTIVVESVKQITGLLPLYSEILPKSPLFTVKKKVGWTPRFTVKEKCAGRIPHIQNTVLPGTTIISDQRLHIIL